MVGSASCWCAECTTSQSNWGTGELVRGSERTKTSQLESLHKYETLHFREVMKNHGHSDVSEKRTPGSVFKLKPRQDEPFCEESITDKPNKKGVTYVKKNVAGVNHHQLIDVDPARSVIPSLHCEMGNCNKLIKDMQDFLLLYAEPLEDVNDKMVRQLFLDSMKEEQEAELDLERNETIEAKKKAKDAKSKRVFGRSITASCKASANVPKEGCKHSLMQSSFRSEEITSTSMEGRSTAAPFAT